MATPQNTRARENGKFVKREPDPTPRPQGEPQVAPPENAMDLPTSGSVAEAEDERRVQREPMPQPDNTPGAGPDLAPSNTPGAEGLIPVDALDALIQARIDQAVAAALAKVTEAKSAAVETVAGQTLPKDYKETFRNDLQPNLVVQEREMIQDEDGEWVPGEGVRGGQIRFLRGYFIATTDNQVRYLDWLAKTPPVDPRDPSRVLGGIPGIYRDDSQNIVRLPNGQHVVRGSNAHKAFLRTQGQK